jgi:O-antigen biosynthesis protein
MLELPKRLAFQSLRKIGVHGAARRAVGQFLREVRGYRLDTLIAADPMFDASDTTPRINLIVLRSGSRWLFGGTATAIRFLSAIEPLFARSRVVVIGENEAAFEPTVWPHRALESKSPSSLRTIVYASSSKLVVGPGDRFIATHWLTAYFLSTLRKAQSERAAIKAPTAAYLVQDFEPAFYPWGSNYLLADSTYRQDEPLVAIFNEQLLRNYFHLRGYRFAGEYVLEPRLNPGLATHLVRIQPGPKQKLILIYGRPHSARNAFELAVEGLIVWAQNYPHAAEWRVVSVGELHQDIRLARGVILQSKGKLSLEKYAACLEGAAIGLSLMVSPHPSYPPLEMAEFSVRVITNAFGGKDLSLRSPYITSLAEVTPARLADALTQLCQKCEATMPEKSPKGTGAFLGGPDEFSFIDELAETLKRG